MNHTPVISTDEDHKAALAEIERLRRAHCGAPQADRLNALTALVEAYEDKRWPLRQDDPDGPSASRKSRVPNADTLAAMAESHEILRARYSFDEGR